MTSLKFLVISPPYFSLATTRYSTVCLKWLCEILRINDGQEVSQHKADVCFNVLLCQQELGLNKWSPSSLYEGCCALL